MTPQTQPIPGHTNQVRNNAGGYSFAKDTWQRLEDFLILGTTGGTYYAGERALTTDNVGVLFEAIAKDGPRVVQLIVDISTAKPPRAPKPGPAIFALAAAHVRGDQETRGTARRAVPLVCRTTDHLAKWFGYRKQLSGKASVRGGASPVMGASTRRALTLWFLEGTAEEVAFRACKAMQRKTPAGESFQLRDALRLAHPHRRQFRTPELSAKLLEPGRQTLLGWIAGTIPDDVARDELVTVDKFLTAKAVTNVKQAVRVVVEQRVPWEFLPSELLREPEVWDALVDTVGLTALLRNLARMTRLGTLRPMGDATRRAVARLTDRDALVRARIHPMDAFLALRVYGSGRSQPNPRAAAHTWAPVPAVLDALEETYELSFGSVEPSGRRLLVAVDSSGSMSGGWYGRAVEVGGSMIGTPYEVGCAMAVMLARIEKGNAHVIDVDISVHRSRVTPRTNLREIRSWRPSGGGTDLSLPFTWAAGERLAVDGFVVLTDSESWAGRSHPSQALESYRRTTSAQARVVVAAMTPAGHTIGDPGDAGVLNMAGLDASLPMVVNGFLRQ
ncbi:TROVE domain-containing protein [Nonomuraea sp. NPDC050328]|uniref:TROVE domain-containing protein n=1 Tax=Nonomuraea sp. NPDC050328 TaxID=3364361 RepID=UPI0037B1ED1B